MKSFMLAWRLEVNQSGSSHVPPTSDITANRLAPFEISFQAPRVF